jgi:hypothetical protein
MKHMSHEGTLGHESKQKQSIGSISGRFAILPCIKYNYLL